MNMEIIQGATDFQLYKETAVAVGKFDGVHIGHRRLLEEILEQKEKGLQACVFTFDPLPAVLFGYSDGKALTTRAEKRMIFEHMGMDVLVEFSLNRETAAIRPERFVRDILADRLQARFIAAGEDVSFGAGGTGDMALLRLLSGECFYEVKTVPKVCVRDIEVNSTYIRSLVERGELQEAERMLGAPYTVSGKVTAGEQIGRTLGFPTANLLPEEGKLLPPNGVYASRVRCRGKVYRAISNVGCRPTVADGAPVGVESYLYDFNGEIYGESIEVELLAFQRPERRFESREALRAQLERDIRGGLAGGFPGR